MFIATLIADGGLDENLLSEVAHQFDVDCTAGKLLEYAMIDEGEAGDIIFSPAASFAPNDAASLAMAIREQAEAIAKGGFGRDMTWDVIVQPARGREKQLIVADMDSTMITVECIDELADYAGIKDQIAEVTEAAMRGELDFAAALDARVALLKGLEESAIDRCLAERVRDSIGASTLIRTMRSRGARSVLVSGGFTRFAEPVGARIGFDRVIANTLTIEEARLTGAVGKPIVDAATKRSTLLAEAEALGIPLSATMAIGDGANDLAMIGEAGLGVAYRAKPVVAAAAGARLDHAPLTALLHAQGIARRDWIEA
ncbi:phosphoserine phosphatase SerB [Sphingomonas sp. AX6]|uniref:phosphoserine phosphatase SerB n=1 Tax=Sphingomonas sp. AX6 TaxID=2653171 RepID=UPI0012F42575|nr:Phosphoserine phosphatase [Sphingomonas sp. AX6]